MDNFEINDKSNPTVFQPAPGRYQQMLYSRCGNSGIMLPKISLGLWHNFGHHDNFENGRAIVRRAFDLGVTHFDLANNYGPPFGAAEENFGRMLKKDFGGFRDELLISSKAGYDMWPGPYGNFGSKKYLVASLDQSLRRMGLDYVDIFYHHRPDPETPLEETMGALDLIVRQGKALYVGISNYNAEETERAVDILESLGTPCLIHQVKYSMLEREPEAALFSALARRRVGSIVFSPLAQGLLTNKYLDGIPANSRAARDRTYLEKEAVEQNIARVRRLYEIAVARGQNVSQLAIAWLLSNPVVTSVLVGVSKVVQLEDNVAALDGPPFSGEELALIEEVLK